MPMIGQWEPDVSVLVLCKGSELYLIFLVICLLRKMIANISFKNIRFKKMKNNFPKNNPIISYLLYYILSDNKI